MGISGKPEDLLNVKAVREEKIPVIKRFSGGGTVIVDENTLFITFIISREELPLPPFPEPILRWSANLYQNAWSIPHFCLRENDYCIGERKCGGNAQYIQKGRWLHHSSFLWDYSEENMNYLLLPPKRPLYRKNRSHSTFLCKLKDYCESQERLIQALQKDLSFHPFELSSWKPKPHRQSAQMIEI